MSQSAKAGPPSQPTVKDWVTQVTTVNQVDLQQRIIRFLLPTYGCLLGATFFLFVLQGFKIGGFNLDSSLLKWLGGATLGEIGGLLTLTIGAVFNKKLSAKQIKHG